MHFYFLIPGIVALICILCYSVPFLEKPKEKFLNFIMESIVTTAVIFVVWTLLFTAVIRGGSYYTYLDMVEEQAVIKQRAATINLYVDKALTEMQAGSGTIRNGDLVITKSTELTDFKYTNYQKEIATLVNELKYAVIAYNSNLVGKRKMYESPFWSWCIVPPDEDMKLLDIDELFYAGPINN